MKVKKIIKQNKWMAGVMMLLLLLAVVPATTVEAASATITLSTDTEEIHAGDTVEVQLTISADATIGDFEAFLSYDDTIFEFYSAASCITGGAGFLKVSDIGASPSAQERTYRIWFKALTQGECEVALYDRPVVYCYTDGTEMSVTGVNKIFTVLPSFSASDNNYLSALYLVDNQPKTVELNPAFSPETQTYQGVVPFEATMVIVSAIAEDSLADVKVEGGKNLEIGNNEVLITVTAENGSERIYTVYINRAEYVEEPTPVPEVPDDPEVPTGTPTEPVITYEPGVTFEQEEEVFVTEYHTYTVCEKPESITLPDGYVQTTLMINSLQVKAYAKQGENPEEFLLLVLKNDAGEVNLYRYDRIEQTLQRVNEEEYVITQVIESNDENLKEAIADYQMHQSILTFAVALLTGMCLILLAMVLWLFIRRKNRG
ncbi:MAG: cadherin-like beta sandwich domain-containing protein [Lachnospiraceae bacterium]|nr:cadherin-like beta sandwich domain-containing protein [Lachnospiraceae bacterium]MBQ8632858.1 cadherin-like beta sandwich domain-containing protein [Lachnospiraceae bacterium]